MYQKPTYNRANFLDFHSQKAKLQKKTFSQLEQQEEECNFNLYIRTLLQITQLEQQMPRIYKVFETLCE